MFSLGTSVKVLEGWFFLGSRSCDVHNLISIIYRSVQRKENVQHVLVTETGEHTPRRVVRGRFVSTICRRPENVIDHATGEEGPTLLLDAAASIHSALVPLPAAV